MFSSRGVGKWLEGGGALEGWEGGDGVTMWNVDFKKWQCGMCLLLINQSPVNFIKRKNHIVWQCVFSMLCH